MIISTLGSRDVQKRRHGNPNFQAKDVTKTRADQNTFKLQPGFETKNGSVIEIGLGLPKPFSQEVNNPFIFMKGTLNKPSRNPLLQCLYRAQEIGGPQSPEFYTSSTK